MDTDKTRAKRAGRGGGRSNRLTARQVETIKAPGRHADGQGLYLFISQAGGVQGRRWIYRYKSPTTGKTREMGLGSASAVTLAEARGQADEYRRLVRSGVDPLDTRKTVSATKTFGEYADDYIAGMEPSWRNAKHRWQWRVTLTDGCAGIRDKAIGDIRTEEVLSVLQPIWHEKPETASRLRGRIEQVLDYAATKQPEIKAGWFGNNPARWRGHLDKVLPKPEKLRRGHHKALPYEDVPAFMQSLRARHATAALMLEFVILTAVRSSEARLAEWGEIDFDKAVWTVPASRLKANRAHRPVPDHRIPLSARALEILQGLAGAVGDNPDGLIFQGQKAGRPLSDMAMTVALRRMKRHDISVHGFRSTFRDWAAETTSFPHEVCEMALAHSISNKVEAAYRRGDLFDKRRQLMNAWADHCASVTEGKVVPLRPGVA